MYTCRLTANDVLVGFWPQKFAAVKLCMYIRLFYNKIHLFVNKKILPLLCLPIQNLTINVFSRALISEWFDRNFRNLCPIFCSRSNIMVYNRAAQHALMFVYTKIDAAPIFGVSRINVQFWHCSRDPKIGLPSIFLLSNTNRWYAAQLHTIIYDCLRNIGAEFPVFHILHANTCSRKIHTKMECVLREHGFGSQIRNNGSSAHILLWQSCLGAPRGRGYSLLVIDQIKINFLKFSIFINNFLKF